MKINCIYFDNEMELSQEIRQTREQLATHGLDLENISFGFIIRGKALVDLPDYWNDIMEYSLCKEVVWKNFIFDGTLFLVGISYDL